MPTFGRVFFLTTTVVIILYTLFLSFLICRAAFCALYFFGTHPMKASRTFRRFCKNTVQRLYNAIITSTCSTYQFLWRLASGRIECSTWVDYSIVVFALCVLVYKAGSGPELWDHPADISRVSSFYGPGAYIAWYMSALTVATRYLWSRSSSYLATPSSGWKPSGDLLAAIAYPLTAFVDSTIQLYRLRFNGDGSYAEFLAASFPLHAASTLALSTASMGRKGSPRKRYMVMIWLYWLMSQPTFVSSLCGGAGTKVYINVTEDYPWSTICGCVCLAISITAYKDLGSQDHPSALPFMLVIQIILQCTSVLTQPPFSVLPATTNVITDFDQAAVLFTTLGILLYSWYEPIISVCQSWPEQVVSSCIRFLGVVVQCWHGTPNLAHSILKKIIRRRRAPPAGVSV